MTNKQKLLEFMKSQRIMAIASKGDDVWITNVFYGVDDDFKIYFISDEDTKHGGQIKKDPNVAFSVAWFNENDHEDRKGIQGQGACRIAETDEEIAKGVKIHNTLYPKFAKEIDVEMIKSDLNKSHVYILEPTYIKYWDDELYGEEEDEEFHF